MSGALQLSDSQDVLNLFFKCLLGSLYAPPQYGYWMRIQLSDNFKAELQHE